MSAQPRVMILMGSDSDLPAMAPAAKVLGECGIPCEVHVTSAHRSPARTEALVDQAVRAGVAVFIVGAGSAAHLAGVVAARTVVPVLGVPLASSDLKGLDALLSTVQMPAGVPVGTLAIGKAGAANAGWLAAQVLALSDPDLRERLLERRRRQEEEVARKDRAVPDKLRELLGS